MRRRASTQSMVETVASRNSATDSSPMDAEDEAEDVGEEDEKRRRGSRTQMRSRKVGADDAGDETSAERTGRASWARRPAEADDAAIERQMIRGVR